MTQPLNLALTLSLNDRLADPLRRSLGEVTRSLTSLDKELANIVRGGERTANTLGAIGQKGREAGQAAGGLRDIGRAADQAERSVGRLGASVANVALRLTSIFAAFKTGQAVFADPMERARRYELDLAKLSNVLYNDRRTVQGRQSGQAEMDSAVRRATAQGVTREEALTGLRVVGAAGGISRQDAMGMLPTLAKMSVAGETSMEDVANVAVKSMKGFGIKPGELGKVLEMALISGQMGAFEMKDMAKFLPQQMALAKSMLGMSGVGDYGTLLAVNQLASNTAGNSAEAGNNVVNLLGKMNAVDTANDFSKAGIDLPGSLAAARGKGVNQVDAFLNLIEGEFGKNKGYVALQAKLKAARAGGDKAGEASTLESMQGILSGSVIGKFLQDRQALMGFLGVLNDREGLERLKHEGSARAGEADLSQRVLMSTAAMKNQVADSAEQARQFDALRGVNDELAGYRLRLAELSVKYPEAAKWIEGMTLAAQAAAGALAALALGNVLTNLSGKGAGGAPGTAGKVAGAVGSARLLGANGMLGSLGKVAAPLALMSELFFTSDRDVQVLKDAEMMKNHRGKGFDDPRIVGAGWGGPMSDAALRLSKAADSLSDIRIHVTTDSAMFSAEVAKDMARDARRN